MRFTAEVRRDCERESVCWRDDFFLGGAMVPNRSCQNVVALIAPKKKIFSAIRCVIFLRAVASHLCVLRVPRRLRGESSHIIPRRVIFSRRCRSPPLLCSSLTSPLSPSR